LVAHAVIREVTSGSEVPLAPGLGASFSFVGDGARILSVGIKATKRPRSSCTATPQRVTKSDERAL